ncbi:MAG: hypothetical protein ACRCTJ_00520 [Brevinema sp.]
MEKTTNYSRYNKRKKNKSQDKHETKHDKKVEKTDQPHSQKQSYSHPSKNFKHPRQEIPKWDHDQLFKASEFKETKAELMQILSEVNPDEIMITPLVLKNKQLKTIKPKNEIPTLPTNTETKTIDKNSATDDLESLVPSVSVKEKVGSNITISISQTCPICNRAIREIMYALHDYEHDCLAHFDCIYKKVSESIKDKLDKHHYLVYLGSGSFGIMENNGNKLTLIEKIYPGAPVEEMLHSDVAVIDEEM